MRFSILSLLILICFTQTAVSQRPPDIPLNPSINRQVVENSIKAINKFYVSADVARQVESGLRDRLARGSYDKITSAFDLIDAVDADFGSLSKDPHLKLAYGHRPGPMPDEGREIVPETPQQKIESRDEAITRNFGFEKVERLRGNIGYIAMNSFVRPEFGGEAAGRAMAFVANTDALILDLRSSSGGSADMVVFLASYFFDEEPYRLGDWFTRVENSVQQWWTYPYVPGGRYLNKPVYILVSRRSFSAVEGLASILQHYNRAIIVGEPTQGGTHPGYMIRVHPNFAVFVPTSWFIYPTGTPTYPIGRPVFPTSKTDYAGTGLKPDIQIASTHALKRAHLEALTKRLDKNADLKSELEPIIAELQREVDKAAKSPQ